jgi:GntP family gluconate:H+ symporter
MDRTLMEGYNRAMTSILLLIGAVVFIVLATTRLRLHPFLALLFAAFGYGLLSPNLTAGEVVEAVNAGFGGTIGYIGIVILAGAIIGVFLEKSGGALRLAEAILRWTGPKRVPHTMACVGYVVSIPVFCDSAFVILSPLGRALATRAGVSTASAAIALGLGLYATHTMVPPTPGPIAAAGILEADLGRVIVWGLLVSVVTMVAGLVYALIAGRNVTPANAEEHPPPEAKGESEGPSALHAAVPILMPLVLIVLRSVADYPTAPFGEGRVASFLLFLGQPVVALLIGVLCAFTLPRRPTRALFSGDGWVGEGVLAAATIIVVTGAGGAFGKVLQASGIGEAVGAGLGDLQLGILLPLVIAAGLKTAQGSSTVAIITTAGILAPLVGPLGLEGETAKALCVVAIGAGAMVVSHANDSYFWVVTQCTGLSVRQGYTLHTVGTLVQGAVAAVLVWGLALVVA